MEYVCESSWEEVQDNWKTSEDNELWKAHYQGLGFKSWEDWRWSRIKLLGMEDREWTIEKTDNVIQEVREMFCDASTRWTDFYDDRKDSTFGRLKDDPFLVSHQRVRSIRENFPQGSQMIGLRNADEIIVLDGHHRATAIAGMDEAGSQPDVNFAIADISTDEFLKLYKGGLGLKIERRMWDVIGLARTKMKGLLK